MQPSWVNDGTWPNVLHMCSCRLFKAAENGDLMFLQSNAHLLRAGLELCSLCAARGGHLEVLQWLRLQDAPLGSQTCSKAAAGGHLAVLQWLLEQGCHLDEATCAAAAMGTWQC